MTDNPKFYDKPGYSYADYWQGREYEHRAEEYAIRQFLAGRHFKYALDVGGGYGRLTKLIATYCDRVDLVEPSQQQRALAEDFLKEVANAQIKDGDLSHLPYPDAAADLVLVVRVLHHLKDITPALQEVARVLQPGGYLLLEVANSAHFKARVRSFLRRRPLPRTPISLATDPSVTFVNHHPESVEKALQTAGFTVLERRSVSNLRLPGLKKVLSTAAMLAVEKPLQKLLAPLTFGPSLVLLARKK